MVYEMLRRQLKNEIDGLKAGLRERVYIACVYVCVVLHCMLTAAEEFGLAPCT